MINELVNKGYFLKDLDKENQQIIVENQVFKNKEYSNFIQNYNGGIFFSGGLILYGIGLVDHLNFEFINGKLNELYGDIFRDLESIGQDLFGNQFCFRKSTGEFVLFDIETSNLESLSSDFLTFLKELFSDSD